jgi:AcrR family transcriptional regulator
VRAVNPHLLSMLRSCTNGWSMSGKTVTSVPKVGPQLTAKVAQKTDGRVRRTRNALGDALIALMQEKPFDTVTVQQVLDRARVGRSTFYAHYRDKNDLFLSDVEEFLEMMSTLLVRRREASNRVAPVRELFAHVADMHQLQTALIASGKQRDVLEMAQEYFARAISQRLKELPASRAIGRTQRTAMAHAFAGALLSLMSWWIDRKQIDRGKDDQGAAASPEAMDDLYHQMVWSGVATQSASPLPMPLNAVRELKKASSR